MQQARLAVSRCAADLFWKNGVDGTSGDMIADAAHVSKRTVWRYFRNKEACVEPILNSTVLHFADHIKQWPLDMSLESYLRNTMTAFVASIPIEDGIAAVRIIALLPSEPALRSAWMMACAQTEESFVPIVAARTGRPADDFDVRLCAASIAAAVRLVDEDISLAAIRDGQKFEMAEITDRQVAAIRRACILPIFDPVG